MSRKRKTPRPQPEAFDVYRCAVGYKMSSQRLQETTAEPYMLAATVIRALAVDVFLKCLYRIRGKDIPEHHILIAMFKQLCVEDKHSASAKFEAAIMAKYGDKYSFTLPEVLNRCRELFTMIRYGWEANLTPEMVTHVPLDLGLWEALEAIQSLIDECEPELAKRVLQTL